MTTRQSPRHELLFAGSVAIVTGASSGIGQAIAVSLARHGATVCASGRDAKRLRQTMVGMRSRSRAVSFEGDLTLADNIDRLQKLVVTQFGRLDILVHSAGMMRNDLTSNSRLSDFDAQYAVNIRAPYALTKCLLPMLKDCRGQIVFINSSLGVNAKRPEVGQYAATKHAMKAFADSLREEVNSDGIRVLTVYPGRTATPRQKRLHQQENKHYRPESLLQPEDIASVVAHCLALPRTAEVTDIHIRPMIKT
jgi:NADP-dependent 3-hydroxy acid dehydrogenase YdfG